MLEFQLTKVSFDDGVWHGNIRGGNGEPRISVSLNGAPLADITVKPGENGGWDLLIPVPPSCLSDGAHVFLIQEETSDTQLGHFSILAGAENESNLRGQVALLRSELDLLKRAFRRHFIEHS